MSEISEEATRLIDEFEHAVEDAVSDYTMACGASYKNLARYNLEDYVAELEHRNKVLEDACEMLRKENGRGTQLLDFWKRLSTNGSKVQE